MRLHYGMSKNRNFAVTLVDGPPGECIFIATDLVLRVMNCVFQLPFAMVGSLERCSPAQVLPPRCSLDVVFSGNHTDR